MPFRRKGKVYYLHGRKYTAKQVRAYYATRGFTRPPRRRKSKSNG